MNQNAQDAVRAHYGAVGDAYVTSQDHASGADLDRMVELAEPTTGMAMLDVATGGGHVVHRLAPAVGSVVATDLTPEILHHASVAFAAWGLTNVTTQVADAMTLPFADGQFDLVTCRVAAHHFPDIPRSLAQMRRVLAADGRLLLVDITAPEGEAAEWINAFETLRDPSHVRTLTIPAWREALAAAGFALGQEEPFPLELDFDVWVARSRTPDDRVRKLRAMAGAAPAAICEAFLLRFAGERPVSFTTPRTLFCARRA